MLKRYVVKCKKRPIQIKHSQKNIKKVFKKQNQNKKAEKTEKHIKTFFSINNKLKTFCICYNFVELKNSRELQMGQCASKRYSNSSKMESKKSIKEVVSSSKKVWMMVKIEEFEALQNSSSELQKNIDKLRGQFLCQSTLLKEIIDDILKLQTNENKELKQRIQQLETAFAASASALAQSSSTMAVTTVAALASDNTEHFV